MRALVAMVILGGCGLKQLMPEGPVVGAFERSVAFPDEPAAVRYLGDARTAFPVLPVLPWGVAYDLDLVMVDRSDAWDMHEYARISGPDGPIWLAKDARLGTLEQTVVSELDGLDRFLPELPVHRVQRPMVVSGEITADRIDLNLAYENVDGEQVEVEYRGPAPKDLEPKRNGGTMGHSRGSLLAVLDVSSRAMATRGTLRLASEGAPLRRIVGLVPFRMALVQTQAGLAAADLSIAPTDTGFAVAHRVPDGVVQSDWVVREDGARVELLQHQDLRDLVIEGVRRDGAFETTGATVLQWGRPTPVLHVAFSPALPDLSRRWEGEAHSRFVMDVNGQEGHAVGDVVAYWKGEEAVVDVLPTAPWWVAERPMRTVASYPGDGTAVVKVTMLPYPDAQGRGARNRSPTP